MAGNTQMNDSERGIFSLVHGISGMLVAVVLLLSILGALTYFAVVTQQANAENYYEVDQNLNSLKMNSTDNHNKWINEKK
jgi:succinate dehydrogenase/fumarate reductase cytochrome b subunit